MKEIAQGVVIEDGYAGVTLGALLLPHGIVMIDAPPRPDDGRAWLAALRGSGPARDRLLVTLDSHPDRSLGARVLDSPVIAHHHTQGLFRQRSAIFKSQTLESGAEWETLTGLSGLRWLIPNLTFDTRINIHWGDEPVLVEAHPGPESGACWVHLPAQRILFIGDCVTLRQPPFLAQAMLPEWLDTLDLLMNRQYRDYQMVCSRGGLVSEKHIRNFRRALADLHKRLEKIGPRKGALEAAEKQFPKILSSFESPARAKTQHSQRLRFGLASYLHRVYGSATPLLAEPGGE